MSDSSPAGSVKLWLTTRQQTGKKHGMARKIDDSIDLKVLFSEWKK
jgi:hypothetical protein